MSLEQEDAALDAAERARRANIITTAPERLFIQQGEEAEKFHEGEEVTWCADRVDDDDVEYVRADKYSTLEAEVEAMRNGLQTELLAPTPDALRALLAPENAREIIEIPAQKRLDPITVFLKDCGPGRGEITITCYGEALGGSWTSFWGAMGKDRGIRDFFLSCDNGYLLTKLGAPSEPLTAGMAMEYGIESAGELERIREAHKNWKHKNEYFIRIIEAVRVALRPTSPSNPEKP